MQIMESRQQQLEAALAGLTATGQPLVDQIRGKLGPAGFGDDIGTYLYIPMLARWLNLDLSATLDVFYYGLCFGSAVLALMCVFAWSDSSLKRILAVTVGLYLIALGFAEARPYTDVYLLNFCAPLMLIPMVAWALRPGAAEAGGLTTTLVVVALMVVFFEFARSRSAAPAVAFTLVALAFNGAAPWRRRLRDLAVFVLVLGLGMQVTSAVIGHRDRYLASVSPSYQPVVAVHPLWHSIYIGLAYLPNPYGVHAHSDTVAADFVRSVDPKVRYLSPSYEGILRDEVVRIVTTDPWFVVHTVWAKLVRIVADSPLPLALLVLGLIAGIRDRVRRGFDVGLVLAVAVVLAPGLLVWPSAVYYLGLHSVCAVALLLGMMRMLHAGPPWAEALRNLGYRCTLGLRRAARHELLILARRIDPRARSGKDPSPATL